MQFEIQIEATFSEMADTLNEHIEVLDDLLSENCDIKTERSISLTLIAIYKQLEQSDKIKELASKLIESDSIRAGYYRHILDSL